MSVVIGCDPDSDKSGIAVYENKKLTHLKCMSLIEIIAMFRIYEHRNPVLHIENVCANNAAFNKKYIKNAAAQTSINRSIGKCQQVQIEIERLAKYYGIKIVHHKISKAWKKGDSKLQFEKLTGWQGSSNEDTRSAAYFGFLGCK